MKIKKYKLFFVKPKAKGALPLAPQSLSNTKPKPKPKHQSLPKVISV